jgi:adenosine deaminase CECR1
MFAAMEEELARFKSDPAHASFWGFRTIWTAPRALPRRGIIQDMDNCITTKLAYPELIAGYDVCGKEDQGRSLKDFLPELFWFRKQCAQEGVEIPFFFHAGETIAAGPESPDDNLYDAVLLGTRRLGHAVSLHRHPLLVDLVKERRILVESCVISNEVLRLSGPAKTHPLPALLARGVPCALGNDVPAMLGQGASGASHDYYQAIQGWDDLGLEGLGALAENSVRWAAFEDEAAAAWTAGVREASLGGGVKAARLQEWATAWERFCLWIVAEFGDEWEDGEEKGDEAGSSKGGIDRDEAKA